MKFTTAGILSAALLVLAPGARAESTMNWSGFYVGVHGGATWLEDANVDSDFGDGEVDFNTGWGAGLDLGYELGNGLRFEGAAEYRQNGLNDIDVDGAGTSDLDGDYSAWSFMANVYYGFDLGAMMNSSFPIRPYVGAGAGYAIVDLDNLEVGGVDAGGVDSEGQFAFQFMAGLDFDLSDNLVLGVDYRYFNAGDPDFEGDGGAEVNGVDYDSHNVMLTLRYRFGSFGDLF